MSGQTGARPSLEDRTVLVTGAVDGIGRATVELLTALGAQVVALDLQGAVAGLTGERVLGVVGDACEAACLDDAIEAGARRFGGVDAAVLNVALERDDALEVVPPEDFAYTVDGTLGVAITGLRAIEPWLHRAGGGPVVLVSSGSGFFGEPGRGGYCTGKAGVNGLGRLAARAFAGSGIRVNVVAPGPIVTPRNEERRRADPGRMAAFASGIPVGRWGEAGEVAAVIAFLLSRRAACLNGAVIPVDGGMAAVSPMLRPLQEPVQARASR